MVDGDCEGSFHKIPKAQCLESLRGRGVNTSGVGRAKHPGCPRTDPPSPHPLYRRGLSHILHFIINQTRRCFPGFQELLSQTLKAEEGIVGTPSRAPRRTEAGGSPGTPYLQLPCRAGQSRGTDPLTGGICLQGEGVRTELNCGTARCCHGEWLLGGGEPWGSCGWLCGEGGAAGPEPGRDPRERKAQTGVHLGRWPLAWAS